MEDKVTVSQPTNVPVAKVQAVGWAGGAVGAVVTLLALTGVIVPDNLSEQAESAIAAVFVVVSFGQAVIQFLAGYIKKSNAKES